MDTVSLERNIKTSQGGYISITVGTLTACFIKTVQQT